MATAGDEISALIFAYAEHLDRGDFAGVGSLFARATYRSQGGAEHRGAEAVRDVLERRVIRHEDGTVATEAQRADRRAGQTGGTGRSLKTLTVPSIGP